jgi:hypothetical protein
MDIYVLTGVIGILMTGFGIIGSIAFIFIPNINMISLGMWSLTTTIPGILLMTFADRGKG